MKFTIKHIGKLRKRSLIQNPPKPSIKMKYFAYSIISVFLLLSACTKTEPVLKIGLVADAQYADQPTAGKRYYRESLWKLAEAIDTFNYHQVDFVQSLGDVIDKDWRSYDSILPIFDQLKPGIETYQLLGNHEFSIDSTYLKGLLERLALPNYYYSYAEKSWRFVVLDATDYAYFSNPVHNRDTSQVNAYFDKAKEESNQQPWNGGIGEQQQIWLKQQLDSATLLNQKVILFSHLPLRPEGNRHNLWNDYEITEILENSPNVVAFINGHNHAGDYVFKNGIHYITLFGMVDTKISSYGILELYKDSLILRGYGNQKSMRLDGI